MTAEIAIMNKKGVALAADSAVTVGGKKIFNSANKLFALSKFHPIGIMIYGNSELVGIPWETIIKIYKNKLGKKSFKTVREAAENFIHFIKDGSNPIFADSNEDMYFCGMVYNFLKNSILDVSKEEFQKVIDEKTEIKPEEVESIINNKILEMHKQLKDRDDLEEFTGNFGNEILNKYKEDISQIIKEVFDEYPVTEKSIKKIKEAIPWIFSKDFFPIDQSGIVVSGFGEDEIFPSLVSFEIEGRINGKLKFKEVKHDIESIGIKSDATINTFAQGEMAHAFIGGINPNYHLVQQAAFDRLLNEEYPAAISEAIGNGSPEIAKKVYEVGPKVLEDLNNRLEQYRRESSIYPILDAVSALPLEDLALMAESLVNLTSFKRKISMDSETVGGPIDVAVISKGDGFIWIKRKHYFAQDLNHQFFDNYY